MTDITSGLLNSALKLIPKSCSTKTIYVPGVFEIPVTISKNIKNMMVFWRSVVLLGVKHLTSISYLKHPLMRLWIYLIINKKPIGNGIITCLNMRQALARKKKGAEAAKAVISILSQK